MTDSKDQADDYRKAVRQFMRQSDEAQDLYFRGMLAFASGSNQGVRKHQATLADRWKAGDRTVIAYCDGNVITHYKAQITDEEKSRLVDLYMKERTDWSASSVSNDDRNNQAELFVSTIADHGCEMAVSEALMPPNQKERTRSLNSVANAFDKFVDSLNELDSAALGWLFATMEDSAAKSGISIRASGPHVPSLKSSPIRAQVEAGEARQAVKQLSEAIGPAIREARKTLPKIDREENDPRLHAAFFLERQLQYHHLPFETTETSFSAECLRTMFDLGGYETDRVSYWLKKVADTPDNQVPYFGAVRKSAG